MKRSRDNRIRLYAEIRRDYQYRRDAFTEDTARELVAKYVVDHFLKEPDRILFQSYVDAGSIRDLAADMKVSKSRLGREIKRIRESLETEIKTNIKKYERIVL